MCIIVFEKIVYSECLLHLVVLLVLAILSWCPLTWPVYIVCNIFSLLNISSIYINQVSGTTRVTNCRRCWSFAHCVRTACRSAQPRSSPTTWARASWSRLCWTCSTWCRTRPPRRRSSSCSPPVWYVHVHLAIFKLLTARPTMNLLPLMVFITWWTHLFF